MTNCYDCIYSFIFLDFSALSKLDVVYVDGNSRLYSIPASLTGVKSVGVHACSVSFSDHVARGERTEGCVVGILAPCENVPSLMEQAAQAVHNTLKG